MGFSNYGHNSMLVNWMAYNSSAFMPDLNSVVYKRRVAYSILKQMLENGVPELSFMLELFEHIIKNCLNFLYRNCCYSE